MRKIRITVLALVLAALCTATALAAGTQAVGDVNGSGDVNMTDMQCLYDLLSTDKYSGSLTDEAGRRTSTATARWIFWTTSGCMTSCGSR